MINVSQETFNDACRTLDIDNINPELLNKTHGEDIINIFFTILNETDDIDKEAAIKIIEAKNTILIKIILNESTRKCIYEFDLDLQHDRKCKFCGGTGLRIIQAPGFIANMDKCPSCLGTGTYHKPCIECFQTGWIEGHICPICKGKKAIPMQTTVKCPTCKGSRFVDRQIRNTGVILNYTNCSVCKGYGIVGLYNSYP